MGIGLKRLKENISFDDKKVNLSLTTFPQVNLSKVLVPLYSHGPSTILTTLILFHFAPNRVKAWNQQQKPCHPSKCTLD